MPFSGNGTFSRLYSWGTDKLNAIPINSSRMDAEDDGFATGLSNCVTKDGQTTTTAAIPFALGATFGAAILPSTSDGAAIGSTAKQWSDLFMATGAVVNYGNGNYTITHSAGDLAFSGTVTLTNTGLHILDTNATHDLIISPGSNLTADRTFTLTTGDANRTLSLAGDLTTAAAFTTSGANTLTLTTTGATNVTLPTTGTLTDIETGTWTPVLTFATAGNLSVSYTSRFGSYMRIGSQVTLECTLTTSAFTHTTASGALQITGLPFASENASGQEWAAAVNYRGYTDAARPVVCAVIQSNSSVVVFSASGSGQTTNTVGTSEMPTGGTVTLRFVITYKKA